MSLNLAGRIRFRFGRLGCLAGSSGGGGAGSGGAGGVIVGAVIPPWCWYGGARISASSSAFSFSLSFLSKSTLRLFLA